MKSSRDIIRIVDQQRHSRVLNTCPSVSNNPSRFEFFRALERLSVVEVVVHYVQAMHHDRDRDVYPTEKDTPISMRLRGLNFGQIRNLRDNGNERPRQNLSISLTAARIGLLPRSRHGNRALTYAAS